MNIIGILRCLFMTLGLQVNLQKSNLFGAGISFNLVDQFVVLTGCKAVCLPFVYLGLPTGYLMFRFYGLKPIIEKFKKKSFLHGRLSYFLSGLT